MDLGEWLEQRRIVAVLDLIDQLPGASRYWEAVQNDPQQAELIARGREEDTDQEHREPWTPRVSEYDLNAILLREAITSVQALRAAVIATAGGKPGSITPFPRPVTEVDRAAARLERAWAESVLTRFGFDSSDL